MRYSGNFAASAAVPILTSFVTALPVSEIASDLRGASFNVTQVLNTAFIPNGAHAYVKALGRYGAPVSDKLKAAALRTGSGDELGRRQGSGSVTTNPTMYDAEYLCPVQIGTPAQTLHLDFDTGSADLWTFSTLMPPQERNGQGLYNPSASSSSTKLPGYTWEISYGDNSGANGIVYTDKVAIGGVTVTTQAVEAAESVSAGFTSDSSSSGLVGLAFSSINTVKPTIQRTFFDNASRNGALAAPLFTSRLAFHKPGTYTFGKIDSTQYVGTLAYTPVDSSQGFWGVTSNGYAVGAGTFTTSAIKAVLDTGTSLLLIPDAAVAAYYSKVSGAVNDPNQGGYVFPCNTVLPSFTYGVGAYRAIIPGQYLNYAPVSPGSSTCFGGIQSSNGITGHDGVPFSIFGDLALKSQFVVWDGGNNRLGFAQQVATVASG